MGTNFVFINLHTFDIIFSVIESTSNTQTTIIHISCKFVDKHQLLPLIQHRRKATVRKKMDNVHVYYYYNIAI